jgi:hypothetical protein
VNQKSQSVNLFAALFSVDEIGSSGNLIAGSDNGQSHLEIHSLSHIRFVLRLSLIFGDSSE